MIAVARTSNTMLNRSGERGHPCLVPDLSGKALKFLSLSMMLAVGLSFMAHIMFGNVPSIPTLLSVFIRNGCCILSNAFSASIDMIMYFFSLLFFNVVYYLFNVLVDVFSQYFVEDFRVNVHQ